MHRLAAILTLVATLTLSAPSTAQTALSMYHYSGTGWVGYFANNGSQSDGYAHSGRLPLSAQSVTVPGARAGLDFKFGRLRQESLILREFGSVDAAANVGAEAGTMSSINGRQQKAHKIALEILNENGAPRRELLRDFVITIDGKRTGSGFLDIDVDIDSNGTIDMSYNGALPSLKRTFFGFGRIKRSVTLTIGAGATRTLTGGGSYDFTIGIELLKPPISPIHVSKDGYKSCGVGTIYAWDTPSRTAHNIDFNIHGNPNHTAAFISIGRHLSRSPLTVLSCPIYIVSPDAIFPVRLVGGRAHFLATVPGALNYSGYAELISVDWRGGSSVSDYHTFLFHDL